LNKIHITHSYLINAGHYLIIRAIVKGDMDSILFYIILGDRGRKKRIRENEILTSSLHLEGGKIRVQTYAHLSEESELSVILYLQIGTNSYNQTFYKGL
jgi:hypothetical protein